MRTPQAVEEPGADAFMAVGGEDTLGWRTEPRRPLGSSAYPDDRQRSLGPDTRSGSIRRERGDGVQDRVRTTAASHHRAIVIEVMGRHAGWIAAMSASRAARTPALLPEYAPDGAGGATSCAAGRSRAPASCLVVVAEGAAAAGCGGGRRQAARRLRPRAAGRRARIWPGASRRRPAPDSLVVRDTCSAADRRAPSTRCWAAASIQNANS
jgi:6-phosphofructokinase 1